MSITSNLTANPALNMKARLDRSPDYERKSTSNPTSPLDLWLRDEQIHSQLLRKEFSHELSLGAVARAVERRGKSPKSPFSRRDADDPSANAALAWKASVEKPVSRRLI